MSSNTGEPQQPIDASKLAGVWFRSHEEEEGDRLVYRGAAFEFPRARAPRPSLTLEPYGSVSVGSAGPADETISAPGTWEASGNILRLTTSGGPAEYEIETLDDDLLVLRRRPEGEGSDG
jgi:hypothetical protein